MSLSSVPLFIFIFLFICLSTYLYPIILSLSLLSFSRFISQSRLHQFLLLFFLDFFSFLYLSLSFSVSLSLSLSVSLSLIFYLSLSFFISVYLSLLVSPLIPPPWMTSAKAMANLNQLIKEEKQKVIDLGLCQSPNSYSFKNILLSVDQITPIVKELQVTERFLSRFYYLIHFIYFIYCIFIIFFLVFF